MRGDADQADDFFVGFVDATGVLLYVGHQMAGDAVVGDDC